MKFKYTPKIYLGNEEIANTSSNDAEQLYIWMLSQANGNPSNIHGEIIDNESHQIIRQFRKCPPD
jgi:hypothetical protein